MNTDKDRNHAYPKRPWPSFHWDAPSVVIRVYPWLKTLSLCARKVRKTR